ncbi:hypothetical protein KM043_012201 [Ampulex compressa]|nr:hypothetical protein KM043_012201 [Ampulex compressa]
MPIILMKPVAGVAGVVGVVGRRRATIGSRWRSSDVSAVSPSQAGRPTTSLHPEECERVFTDAHFLDATSRKNRGHRACRRGSAAFSRGSTVGSSLVDDFTSRVDSGSDDSEALR